MPSFFNIIGAKPSGVSVFDINFSIADPSSSTVNTTSNVRRTCPCDWMNRKLFVTHICLHICAGGIFCQTRISVVMKRQLRLCELPGRFLEGSYRHLIRFFVVQYVFIDFSVDHVRILWFWSTQIVSLTNKVSNVLPICAEMHLGLRQTSISVVMVVFSRFLELNEALCRKSFVCSSVRIH